MSANRSDGGHYVELLEAKFFDLLRHVLAQVGVDEDWYLAEYPDVADAIGNGAFASATHHFESDGFKEGRLPQADWSLLGSNANDGELYTT